MTGSPIIQFPAGSTPVPKSAASLRRAPEELALVADIGGTNARFALASLGNGGGALIERHWPVSAFGSFADAARAFLDETAPDGGVHYGIVADASPANGDRIKVTNSAWQFSLDETRRALGFEALYAINDFAANSWAIADGGERQFTALGGPEAVPDGQGTFAVVGPGTGLGIGAILRGPAGTAVISSEGGHADFAPVTDEEIELLAWLRRRHHRVSYERLLCGPGLLNIYHAIGGAAAVTAPEQVTGAKDDPLAARAIRIFCEVLGSFAGNAALTFGAWGGVYLAGNLLQPIREELRAGGFRARFDDKGRFGKTLAKVPTLLVDEPALGLIGAAAALRHRIAG
jgi:glucokinase